MRSRLFLAWWRNLNSALTHAGLPCPALGEALELFALYEGRN